MPTPIPVPPVIQSRINRERLIGDCPNDPDGHSIDPGDALPISPTMLVPTMLTRRELNYLHFLGSQVRSLGRIIELGCFLGGSTRPLIVGYLAHHPNPTKMLVYDHFIAPLQRDYDRFPELWGYGLSPNEHFLERYKRLHAEYLEALLIRDGELPGYGSAAQIERLYPEGDPIALLFVDAAKSWGVHWTIAHAFYPSMEPMGMLVHQDFGDFRTPWIVIHLYQLRDFFEPLDRILDSTTVSFRCLAPPTDLDKLAKAPQDFDSSIESPQWASLIDYWSQILSADASGFLSGYRATHALHAGDAKSTIHFALRYERWLSTAECPWDSTSPYWAAWVDWVNQLPGWLAGIDASDEVLAQARTLGDLHTSYQRIETPLSVTHRWKTETFKAHRWHQIEDRLVAQGIDSVILLGAGRHTRWLIGAGWPTSSIKIRCILDDHPSDDLIGGIPVCTPEQFVGDLGPNCVILPSSDAYEEHLIERGLSIFGSDSIPIWRVYTDSTFGDQTHDQIARSIQNAVPEPSTIEHMDLASLDPSPSHRQLLGLEQTRGWVEALRRRARCPSWARGHINARDAAFIWDHIEAIAPHTSEPVTIVEIGTASGVSGAIIGGGVDAFLASGSEIHSFDIMDYCYFDPTHRVGDAIEELASELGDMIHLHPHANARDAAACFSPGQVQLAFIDADHRHPAPALDLLALLPVLSPGAWVVLHDIELDRIQSNTPDTSGSQSGPNRLFDGWAFNKVREDRSDLCESNIGALQIPDDLFSAQRMLIELINAPINQRAMQI